MTGFDDVLWGPEQLRDRLARAATAASAAGVDALIVTPGTDLRYLTGYDAPALERLTCLILSADGSPVMLVPGLEVAAAKASPVGDADIEVVGWAETTDPFALAASVLGEPGVIAVNDQMWARAALALMTAVPDARMIAAGGVLSGLRMIKSPAEVAALRHAGALIDDVHACVGDWLRPGRTENEVARDIADAIADTHERVDFVIVGSGPNGASPHHSCSDRVLRFGDVVVVDIGGTTAAGYCSDSTRTYALGEPPPEFMAQYDVLLTAQQAATKAVAIGVRCEQIDAAARQVLVEAGIGELFIHRTGHGIGLDTHEDPYIVEGNATALAAGMAFSIEPGFYLADTWGARIEDIVVCSDDGVVVCNNRPRELAILAV